VFAIFAATILITIGIIMCATLILMPAGVALILTGLKLVFP
jgi:hypothetical protein